MHKISWPNKSPISSFVCYLTLIHSYTLFIEQSTILTKIVVISCSAVSSWFCSEWWIIKKNCIQEKTEAHRSQSTGHYHKPFDWPPYDKSPHWKKSFNTL